jgi:hypothetical protein
MCPFKEESRFGWILYCFVYVSTPLLHEMSDYVSVIILNLVSKDVNTLGL